MALKISIFIPTYNSQDCISNTIQSVLNQSFSNFELLIVDDGSTDKTWEILQYYQKKDERIKLFQKSNQGSVPYSWKYIFPYISGDYTLYMSHDDILVENSLENMVLCIITHHNIDCVIPRVIFFKHDIYSPETEFQNINDKYKTRIGQIINGEDAFILMLDYSIPGFALWRTSLIKKFRVPLSSFNSDEYAQRLWVRNCRKVIFSKALFGYRQSDNSIVRGFKPYHIFSLDTNLRLYTDLLKSNAPINIINKYQNKYFKSLCYLSSKFYQIHKHLTLDESKSIRALIDKSYESYSSIKSYDNIIMYLMCRSRFMFNILCYLKSYLNK